MDKPDSNKADDGIGEVVPAKVKPEGTPAPGKQLAAPDTFDASDLDASKI